MFPPFVASGVYQPTAEAAAAYHADEASDVVRPLRVPRKTYVIVCRNQAGSARARVTFQVSSGRSSSSRRCSNRCCYCCCSTLMTLIVIAHD